MYAIFQMNGMQYKAETGAIVRVATQTSEAGAKLNIDDVLLVNDGATAHIGAPFVKGAKVEAEVVSSGLGDKVISFKYKRRTKYRRTIGHRQGFTDIKITRIVAP